MFNVSLQFAYNGLALGEEADFEAQNCLPALNLIRSTKLYLSTEPAFLPSACCAFVVFLGKSQFSKYLIPQIN
jgi:hypothetical protein